MARSLGLALWLAAANFASAQYVVSARAGTINFTTGQVSVDDQPVDRNPAKILTLRDGQLVRTKNGRAEILVGPAVFLRLGPRSVMRMVNSRLEDTQIEIQEGTALLEVIDVANGGNLHVLMGGARTAFRGTGLHRFDANAGDLYVYGGHATVSTSGPIFDSFRGRVVHLRDVPTESRFDARKKDDLLQWSARRSFRLFISNPAARARLSNWEVVNIGIAGDSIASDQDRSYYFNPDFGVTFVSRTSGGSGLGGSTLIPPGDPNQNPMLKPPTGLSGNAVGYSGSPSGGSFPH